MAISPKIADNEMAYFQYKAREKLLLKKEDCEWKAFCKQIAPECAACLAEKPDSKESKDIGIQAFPGKPVNKIEKKTFGSKSENDKIPEALENIKTRLEKIDFAISKMNDVSYESVKATKPVNASMLHNEKVSKSFEEQRKLLIQNSLKASLQKLHSSSHRMLKPPPPSIKLKNSSYILPHDLQVKRAAARNAYLLSQQTKPKVSFKNMTQRSKKNVQTSLQRKNVPKHTSNPRKKTITKKETKESRADKVETLIEGIGDEEAKDENIERVVDGILEDLLLETALDLNKIKHRKFQRESNAPQNEEGVNKKEETVTPISSLTSCLTKSTKPKALTTDYDDDDGITKIKRFLDSPKKAEEMNINFKEEHIDKNTNIFSIEDTQNMCDQVTTKQRNDATLYKTMSEVKILPKFECGVSNVLMVDPEMAKDIVLGKDRFCRYLKSISRIEKGNFNPWILNEVLAESILDECINDVAGELNEMLSDCIQDLYNQEFIQHVED